MIESFESKCVKTEFKLRFNTAHADTGLYWRVIIGNDEYLVREIDCQVPTYSESSFDTKANATKYHLAGVCNDFSIDEALTAHFKQLP